MAPDSTTKFKNVVLVLILLTTQANDGSANIRRKRFGGFDPSQLGGATTHVIQLGSIDELMKLLNGMGGGLPSNFGGGGGFGGGQPNFGGGNPGYQNQQSPFGNPLSGFEPFGNQNGGGGNFGNAVADLGGGGGGGGDFRQAALEETNKYRAMHGAAPLVLDEQLNRESQSYAEELARKNVMKHSAANGYGENLFMQGGIIQDPVQTARKAVKAWYDEVGKYNYNNPTFTSGTGHFTALVWKGSRKMGFGLASNQATRSTYVVARYVPAGNMMGDFANNVGPLRGRRAFI